MDCILIEGNLPHECIDYWSCSKSGYMCKSKRAGPSYTDNQLPAVGSTAGVGLPRQLLDEQLKSKLSTSTAPEHLKHAEIDVQTALEDDNCPQNLDVKDIGRHCYDSFQERLSLNTRFGFKSPHTPSAEYTTLEKQKPETLGDLPMALMLDLTFR